MGAPVILADTGPLVALLNSRDHHHAWAISRFDEFTAPLVTCEAVIAETLFLLQSCPGATEVFLKLWNRGAVATEFTAESEKAALQRLMKKYSDLPMSFADACLVRMAELHAEVAVWTLDTDFSVYRRHGRQTVPRLMPEELR